MSADSRQNGHFEVSHKEVGLPSPEEYVSAPHTGKQGLVAHYKDYFLKRPMFILIGVGLALEVQPYTPIQPSFFLANRAVNLETTILEGTEEEVAHKEAVKSELLAQIEHVKRCEMERDIAANNVRNQCVESDKGSGYCRFVYEQAKALACPKMPEL